MIHRQWPIRVLHHSLGWTRYLLLWPAIGAYRRRARRSLRWRLGGSYLLVLFLSLGSALVIVGILAGFAAIASNQAAEEPADDARTAARVLGGLNLFPATLDAAPSNELTEALAGLAGGKLTIYRAPDQTKYDVRPTTQLRHIRSVSIVDADGKVWASSDPTMLSTSLSASGDSRLVRAVAATASGSTDLGRNSELSTSSIALDHGAAGVGGYPLRLRGPFVWVEKSAISSPTGGRLWRAELGAAVSTFSVSGFVILLPGLVVASVFALRSARTIVAPIDRINAAAQALADGDLTRRVDHSGEDEIAKLAASFDGMAGRLEEAISGLNTQRARAESLLDQNRQLVANVAHELRTPVAIIRGHLEALEESADATAPEERMAILLAESTRLELLIDDLFRAASAEAEPLPLQITTIDAVAVAREAAEPLVVIAKREAGVTLVVDLPAGPTPCQADRQRLVRVLQILLRNAIRHTPEGGLVLVQIAAAAPGAEVTPAVEISVSDSGEGIAAEDLPQIFTRFYQGRHSDGRGSGVGLGLAIAHDFIEAMDGSLCAANAPVQGAVFTVQLRGT